MTRAGSAAALLALFACEADRAEPDALPPAEIVLLVHPGAIEDEPHAVMEALFTGELVEDGPCLRMGRNGNVPIWHPGTTIEMVPGGWEVRVGETTVAKSGKPVAMGGGFVGPARAGPMNDLCPGPYFLVGSVDDLAAQEATIERVRERGR